MKHSLIFRLVIFILLIGFASSGVAAEDKKMAEAALKASDSIVRLYGAGGPGLKAPLKECAKLFKKEHGIEVELTLGPEKKWMKYSKLNADLYFPGTESRMSLNNVRDKDLMDISSRTLLYLRGAVIVVRKGNPKSITKVEDLAKPGIKIIDVVGPGLYSLGEDTASLKGVLEGVQKNTVFSGVNGGAAAKKWKSSPDIDAWITLEPWILAVKDSGEIVRIPEPIRIYRHSSIALAKNSEKKVPAQKFIQFLKTEKAHAVFKKFGWE